MKVRLMIAYKVYRRFMVYLLIIAGLVTGCTKSNVSTNTQTTSCNTSDLSIFPHPNDAGIILTVLAIDKNTRKTRVVRINDEVCD